MIEYVVAHRKYDAAFEKSSNRNLNTYQVLVFIRSS